MWYFYITLDLVRLLEYGLPLRHNTKARQRSLLTGFFIMSV